VIFYLFKKLLWGSGLGIMLLGYGILVEPAQLKIREVELVSDKYKGPDIRIGLVTDIHINSLGVPPSRVLKIVEALNSQKPDLVLIPGDFVAGHDRAEDRSEAFNKNVGTGISYLSRLSAPRYATLGNHDAWWSSERVTKHLEAAGVQVLDNRAAIFRELCIVGLADSWTGYPNRSAYEECASTSGPPVVFTHSPNAWRLFRSDSVLALAGHTHGGQVNLPLIGRRVNAIELSKDYSYGFSKIGGVDMFVSAGVGTSRLPIRFRAPPEIVILTLHGSP